MALNEAQTIEAYIDTPKSMDFYKQGFTKYNATGIDQFAWHWSWWAMFGGIFYLLYRKLYLEALVFFVLFATVGMIPFVGLIMWGVSGGVLPYFVYKRYKKTLSQVEENIANDTAKLEALRVVGGVNQWAIWLGVALHVALWIGTIYMTLMLSSMPR